MVGKIVPNLLDILFPPVCFGCKNEGVWLCQTCQKIYINKPLINRVIGTEKLRVTSLAKYGDERIKFALHHLKYNSVKKYGEELGKLLGQKLPAGYFTNSVLVPIPLCKSKLRARGFNQAQVIAAQLANKYSVAIIEGLAKIKSIPSQVEMKNRPERLANIKGSFGLSESCAVLIGKKVILVDDVATTGATIGEIRKVLLEAGATSVIGLTLAH